MSSDGLDGATSLPEELPPTFENELLDVGDAASWTASSFKAGHGIEALRSLDPTVYFEYVASQQFDDGFLHLICFASKLQRLAATHCVYFYVPLGHAVQRMRLST